MINLTINEFLQLALYYTTASFVAFYVLWILYLAVMNLKRAKEAGLLSPTALFLGRPVLVVGLILDFIVNVGVMTLVLLELPQETTVTDRLKRLNRDPKTSPWRRKVVAFFEPILDPYDPSGDHI